jgi:hypothetical protein
LKVSKAADRFKEVRRAVVNKKASSLYPHPTTPTPQGSSIFLIDFVCLSVRGGVCVKMHQVEN